MNAYGCSTSEHGIFFGLHFHTIFLLESKKRLINERIIVAGGTLAKSITDKTVDFVITAPRFKDQFKKWLDKQTASVPPTNKLVIHSEWLFNCVTKGELLDVGGAYDYNLQSGNYCLTGNEDPNLETLVVKATLAKRQQEFNKKLNGPPLSTSCVFTSADMHNMYNLLSRRTTGASFTPITRDVVRQIISQLHGFKKSILLIPADPEAILQNFEDVGLTADDLNDMPQPLPCNFDYELLLLMQEDKTASELFEAAEKEYTTVLDEQHNPEQDNLEGLSIFLSIVLSIYLSTYYYNITQHLFY